MSLLIETGSKTPILDLLRVSRNYEYPQQEISKSKLVGNNDFVSISLGPGDSRTFVFGTRKRLTCTAVCVWGRKNGGDHVLLSHFYGLDIKEHLKALKKASKRDVTVAVVAYTLHSDFSVCSGELDVHRRICELAGEDSFQGNDIAYHGVCSIAYPIVETPVGRVFDMSIELREGVRRIFKVEPHMWYVPLSLYDFESYLQNETLFQLSACRILDGDGVLRRLIMMPGTDYQLLIE